MSMSQIMDHNCFMESGGIKKLDMEKLLKPKSNLTSLFCRLCVGLIFAKFVTPDVMQKRYQKGPQQLLLFKITDKLWSSIQFVASSKRLTIISFAKRHNCLPRPFFRSYSVVQEYQSREFRKSEIIPKFSLRFWRRSLKKIQIFDPGNILFQN